MTERSKELLLRKWYDGHRSAKILREIRRELSGKHEANSLRLLEIEAVLDEREVETDYMDLEMPGEIIASKVPSSRYFREVSEEERKRWYNMFNRTLTKEESKIIYDIYWSFVTLQEEELFDLAMNPLIETESYDELRLRPSVIQKTFESCEI